MDKLEILEELLPGFQQFLKDLTTCRLSSALEAQVEKYNQNIEDYIEQHCTMPASRAPEPPKVNNGLLPDNTDEIAKLRELSRLSHAVSKDDTYYNVHGTDTGNTNQGMDEYEAPTISPTVPISKRPPLRVVDDDPTFYAEPEEIEPSRPQGKSATMPLPPRKSEMDGSDSGGTLMSFQSSHSSQQDDMIEYYEDLPDADNFNDDSFSSTDYEDYDEEEIKTAVKDTNANKTKPKADDKSKMDKEDKLALFKKQHENDGEVDHIGVLYTPSKVMTLSKRSLGKWGKRYCLARDMHLLCYKSPDSKRAAQDLVLFGYTVTFVGQEGRQENVFTISHPNRMEMFSAESREEADKWIEVLKGYATAGNDLDLSSGVVESDSQSLPTHTRDEKARKFLGLFKRDKKSKDSTPQLSIDDKGILSGYINVMGAKYGEAKWRKKFLMIQKGCLECYTEDGETLQFDFSLNGTDMMPADPKVCRRKTAMRISRENETLIYVETLNHLDMGPFLKKFMDEMVVDQKKDSSSTLKRGMVSSILRAFEKQNSDPGNQVFQQEKRKKSETPSPSATKKAQEAAPDSGKKDKKSKKKEEKKEKGKKDKKGKNKEGVVVKEEEVVAKEEEKAPVESTNGIVKKRASVRMNKFEKSDKSHLLDVDRLQIERKEVDAKKRQVTKQKIDLSTQKRETTDPKQKELLDIEFKKAQQEWSECSKRLTWIDSEIEKFTKGGDAIARIEEKQQMRMSMVRELSFKDPMMVRRTRDRFSLCATRSWSLDTASAEMVKNEISETKKKETAGASSPGMEVAKRGGNVKDKLKMFQDMGNK